MSNVLSGFQIKAATGLLQGNGIAPPNVTANLTAYYSLAPVNNWRTIYYNANASGVTIDNVNELQNIGANTFPQLFGQVPYPYSKGLLSGPLFDKVISRISYWFGSSISSSVFIQVLSKAQVYASQAADLINSATSAQWPNGASDAASGGLSTIVGNTQYGLNAVATAFKQLGLLLDLPTPLNGFSNAGCFQQILNSGYSIGNLNNTFFGKTITDASGTTYIIGSELFTEIFNNPVGRTDDDTFKIAALNPLDILLGDVANTALSDADDLDAVKTFFEITGFSSNAVTKWTDCLNIPLMLGIDATNAIKTGLNLGSSDILDVYTFLDVLINNIRGISNLTSIAALGEIMSNIKILSSSNLTTVSTIPMTSNEYIILHDLVGVGSGANSNPTVADILGKTNVNDTITDTLSNLSVLKCKPAWHWISSDTANVANALVSGVVSNVLLSDGTMYSDINELASNASILINKNANILANSYITSNSFNNYNSLAETHNNSVLLMSKTDINVNNILPSVASLISFPEQLASITLENDEISGLSVIQPLIDSTDTGAALNAVIIESINNNILLNAGLPVGSYDANTVYVS
jgi:hypothetical protein